MAAIWERKHESGRSTFRIRFKKKGIPEFSLTFDDWDVACEWVERNELSFYADPDKFFKWREENEIQMRRDRVKSKSNILRRKFKKVL